jgi:hypothetical protein
VDAPKVDVRFERVTVEADVLAGRRAVPTLLNCAINAARVRNERAKFLPSPSFYSHAARMMYWCGYVVINL